MFVTRTFLKEQRMFVLWCGGEGDEGGGAKDESESIRYKPLINKINNYMN